MVNSGCVNGLCLSFCSSFERNCPDTTIRAYRNDLIQLAEFLNDKPISSVTIGDLRGWLESMRDYAASTIGRKLATARSFFRFGIREGWVEKNPARELDIPRRDRVLPTVLTEEQIESIINLVDSKRDRAILEVLYSSGARVSELVGLNLEDLGESFIKVFGKGGVERICPIDGNVHQKGGRDGGIARVKKGATAIVSYLFV
ncbi:MAG: site-specific integrase, partial [Pirellulales bacterium]|nr:site-specific integrase [Pirellulales bacterium]